MSTQISPQIKIVAAVGLVLALALGASMKLMGGSSGTSSSPTPTVTQQTPTHPTPARTSSVSTPPATHAARTAPAATTPAVTTPAATHPAATTATHAAKPKPAKPAKPKVKPVPEVAPNGLPGVLDQLLHIHTVVVVALWDPEIPSDRIALNEAQAGAKDANAGFLAVNVLDERVATPLTALAGNGGLLPSPGILIYRAPAVLMNTVQGFADREAVAQAVADALLVDPAVVAAASAASVANSTATTPVATTPTAATTP